MKRHTAHLLAIGLVIVVLLSGCARAPEAFEEPVELIPTAAQQQVTLRSTIMYYQDDNRYLIPVMRRVLWEDGIAKATLSYMVAGGDNDLEAARLGLKTVLPEGCVVDINITDNLAVASINSASLATQTAGDEALMVSAIVNTLTEFPTVAQVQILIDGDAKETLRNGTAIVKPLTRGDINLESVETAGGIVGAKKIKLFFESDASQAMVPITRMVFGRTDVTTAVVELLKGPKKDSGLSSKLPSDAALLSVTQKDGVVTVDFTGAFKEIAEQSDGGQQALKALVLTCTQFPDVKEVRILVDGKPYDPAAPTIAAPTFVNSEDDTWGADLELLPATPRVGTPLGDYGNS